MRTLLLRGIVLAVLASACWANAAVAAAPALVGSLSNSTSLSGANAVAVSGNFAYEVSYWSGQLNVINISNPAAPSIAGSTPALLPSITAATNVTISSHYAFVTSKNRNRSTTNNDDGTGNSLTIVDVSKPSAPSVVGTLHDATNLFGAYAVAVSGTHAYVASQGLLSGEPATPDTSRGSFSVIDISNPAGPTLVGHIDNSQLPAGLTNGLNHATSVAISGHYAFVTAFNGQRLTTIDISNPSAPAAVHTLFDAPSLPAPDDLVISGNFAYVVNQVNAGMELAVVNLSNPLAPTIAGTLTDSHLLGSYRVRARGNFVYVSANSAASVAAINVSTPTAPKLAASLTDAAHLSNVTGLDVSGNGRYIIATSPRRSTDPHQVFPPYPLQTGGPTNTGTLSVIDLGLTPVTINAPKITGTAQQGKTLTASTGTWSGAPSFSYQWQRCNAKATGCKSNANQTKNTYRVTATDVGSRLEVVITATNSAGSASASSLATKVVTWSSGKFASAKLAKSHSSTPGLSLSVPPVGGGLLLQRLAISLPKGLSFAGSHHAFAQGLLLRSRSGKIVLFKVSLKHGTLTITLKKPSSGITLALARGLISKTKAGKLKSPKLKLSLNYKGKPARRGSVKLRLA